MLETTIATTLSLEGNARQWGVVVLDILEQHYSECLTVLLEDASKQKSNNWKTPFEVATRWARRNLMRLRQSTIDRAKRLIRLRNQNSTSSSEEEEEEDDASSPSPSPPRPPRRPKHTRDKKTQDHEEPGPSTSRPSCSSPPPRKSKAKTKGMKTSAPRPPDNPPEEALHHSRKQPMTLPQPTVKHYPLFNLSSSLAKKKKKKTLTSDNIRTKSTPSSPPPPPARPALSSSSEEEIPLTAVTHQSEISKPLPQRPSRSRKEPTPDDNLNPNNPTTVPETQLDKSLPTTSHHISPSEDEEPSDDSDLDENYRSLISNDESVDARADQDHETTLQGSHEAGGAVTSGDAPHRAPTQEDDPLPSHQHPLQLQGKVNVHLPSNRKTSDWVINICNATLLIGDSNLESIPNFNLQEIQVESFPEATFRDIANVFQNSSVQTAVQTVILSLGLFNRKQNTKSTTIKQVQTAVRNAKNACTGAKIIIPLVHIPDNLPPEEKDNLSELNKYITDNHHHLTLIDPPHFQTRTNFLWKPNTAQKIFDHWLEQLNL